MLHTYFTPMLLRLGEKSALNVFVLGALFYTIFKTVVGLVSNYLSARKTGLRILISPITPYTLQWRLVVSIFEPFLIRIRWYRAIDWTCAWQDGNRLHEELGECFIVVSPGLIVMCTSDPKTIEHVLKDWRGFVKPDNVNEILGTFGQNVDTSNGDDWPRHRKIVSPCFSERASATVWTEAISQSNVLLAKWLSSQTADIIQDTGTLALNVISAVAFENHQVSTPKPGYVLSLHDSLKTVMSTSISPALEGIMPWLDVPGLRGLMPPSIKKLMLACDEFRNYTTELIADREPPNESSLNLNLINTLVKANAAETKARLSDSELRGNVFIFTVGGLESTSATLAYALALLAIHPEVQEWVSEELDEVIGSQKIEEMEYKDVFPKLKRVLYVMFETLRIYSPSPPLPRSFSNPVLSFSVPTSAPTLQLPPGTQIMLNSWSSHAALSTPSPQSSAPMSWDPKRWLLTSSPNLTGFYPWGFGPRICPGMKFSQVEFCAVVVSVLRKCRLHADRVDVMRALGGSKSDPLLLNMGREIGVKVVEK